MELKNGCISNLHLSARYVCIYVDGKVKLVDPGKKGCQGSESFRPEKCGVGMSKEPKAGELLQYHIHGKERFCLSVDKEWSARLMRTFRGGGPKGSGLGGGGPVPTHTENLVLKSPFAPK